ncbi:MAG: biotin--[acetyl-CoA-carboxylase] ligase [Micrococcales bacterium]|nr:biotin--[acetyl-CoA-carboxylase] ligase [Micrococcales bacterium]
MGSPLRADVLHRRLVVPAGPVPRLVVVDQTGSTNDDVLAGVREDPDAWPTGTLLLADHQSAGHGRAGRSWVSPPGTSVTGTFVVRPASGALGWLPLVVGLGVVHALGAAGVPAWLKWPNDVLVVQRGAEVLHGWGEHRKVAGILVQAAPDGTLAVGVGLNVTQDAAALAVPTATSLALAGGPTDRDGLVVALADALASTVGRWCAGEAALPDEVAAVCVTLGRTVTVELPGGARLVGQAVYLAPDGSLVVADHAGEHHVLAGDVVPHSQGPFFGDECFSLKHV